MSLMDRDVADVERVIEWACDHEHFDSTFVESLLEQLDNGRELTDAQREGLDNIIERFNI